MLRAFHSISWRRILLEYLVSIIEYDIFLVLRTHPGHNPVRRTHQIMVADTAVLPSQHLITGAFAGCKGTGFPTGDPRHAGGYPLGNPPTM